MKPEVSFLLLFLLFGFGNTELFGIYQRLFNNDPLTLSIIDPHTANRGSPIFSSGTLQVLFGGSSDFDTDNKVYYFPALTSDDGDDDLNSTIVGLDCSNLSNVKQVMSVDVPFTAYIVKYSPKLKKIVVGGSVVPLDVARKIIYSQDPRSVFEQFMVDPTQNDTIIVEIGTIDPLTQKYTKLTQLPDNHFFTTVSGSPSTIDYNTNTLHVATVYHNSDGSNLQNFMDSVDLSTGTLTTVQTNMIGTALTYWNGQVLSIAFPQTDPNIYSGYFDFQTNNYVSKYTLPDNLQYVITGITAMDIANEVYYTLLGNGTGPPVALSTINAGNCTLAEYHYFSGDPQNYDQAQFLFTISQ